MKMFNQSGQKVYGSITNIVGSVSVDGDAVNSAVITGNSNTFSRFKWNKGDTPRSRRLFYKDFQANVFMKDEKVKFNVVKGIRTVLDGEIDSVSSAVAVVETYIEIAEM